MNYVLVFQSIGFLSRTTINSTNLYMTLLICCLKIRLVRNSQVTTHVPIVIFIILYIKADIFAYSYFCVCGLAQQFASSSFRDFANVIIPILKWL